jgi:predicted transcriptional regulator
MGISVLEQSKWEHNVTSPNLLELTSEVVAAFVSNNSVPANELPALIQTVHASVAKLASGEASEAPKEPAVPVRKSVTADYLICLEDGKKFKSLKRHLAALGLTPEQYRAKWDLKSDYPMVAANYAAQRSELAKKIGLGQNRAAARARKRGRSSAKAVKA